MTLSTDFERVSLPLADPFGISRGTTEAAENVLVRVQDGDGNVGVGAAAPSEYYGETPDSVATALPDLLVAVEEVDDPHAQQRIARALHERAPEAASACGAVSVAVHDLAARQQGEPLYRRWGLDPAAAPATSFTIGIDTPERMGEKAASAREAGYPILKVKLGTEDDRARIGSIREAAPEARIRVDANTAWTPAEAIEHTSWLADHGVEFVEQPVPADDIDGLRRVSEEGSLPVAADESCVTAEDVPRVADAVDIVVVKVDKCGGLRAAARQIAAADAHGLETMFGCMVASNAGMAGACHLAPLVDYADLDGALLLADDPYDGVPMPEGRLALTAVGAGTGARPR
ncbi:MULTISPECIES: dipeptide epimerase [Salinibaculum]|uniref:dipeptide epimerase n=1 Tax=Salinibaculum TaxID=2732368 RepID=UPI0030CAE0A0